MVANASNCKQLQANGSKCPLDNDNDNDYDNEKGVWGKNAREEAPPLPLCKRQENSSPVSFFAHFSQIHLRIYTFNNQGIKTTFTHLITFIVINTLLGLTFCFSRPLLS